MKLNKRDRVVIITGATAGVGRALVREFAKQGAKIGLIARDQARLAITAAEATSMGATHVSAISTDTAEYNQVEAAAWKFEKELGPIDVWINNAMVSVFSPAKEMNPNEYKRVTDVTYLGYVYGTLCALKFMLPRNRGVIIQVGSALAYRGIPLQSAYCASKHAVQGFTESVRSELIHDKSEIKISMVQLPALNTPQFSWVKSRLTHKPQPIPPIFQPEVAARAISWAVDHYRREWYVGWPTVLAIIGDKIAPGLGDKYLAHQYKSQQYDGLANPNQRDNLFETVPGDYAAHGDFDSRASARCVSFWLNKQRHWIIAIVILVILLLVAVF